MIQPLLLLLKKEKWKRYFSKRKGGKVEDVPQNEKYRSNARLELSTHTGTRRFQKDLKEETRLNLAETGLSQNLNLSTQLNTLTRKD